MVVVKNGVTISAGDSFSELTAVIQADDYNWLRDNAPAYATAVEMEVAKGCRSPDDIYRHIMRMTYDGREGLAVRCKNAAAHLPHLPQRRWKRPFLPHLARDAGDWPETAVPAHLPWRRPFLARDCPPAPPAPETLETAISPLD